MNNAANNDGLVTCPKCFGVGNFPHLAHIDQGLCYRCDGTGRAEPVASRPLPPPSISRIERMRLDLRTLYRGIRSGSTDWEWATDGTHRTEADWLYMMDHVPGSREAFRALGCPV